MAKLVIIYGKNAEKSQMSISIQIKVNIIIVDIKHDTFINFAKLIKR